MSEKTSQANPKTEEEFEKALRKDAIEARTAVRFEAKPDDGKAAKPLMSIQEALKSNEPGARQLVIDHAIFRNRRTTEARPKKRFLVDDNQKPVAADNPVEALAIQNDIDQDWPGPIGRKVREVTAVEEEEFTTASVMAGRQLSIA